MTAEQAVMWALGEVGVTESPPGSNRVKYWEVLPSYQGGAWCGAFVWDALLHGDADLSWTTVKRFVYTPAGLADAKTAGVLTSRSQRPQRGDIGWMNFDSDPGPEHVVLIVGTSGWPRTVQTVEGNTSVSGSQSNGGQVLRRTRSVSSFLGFATMTYGEDDMQLDDTINFAGFAQGEFERRGDAKVSASVKQVLEWNLAFAMRIERLLGAAVQGLDYDELGAAIAAHLPEDVMMPTAEEIATATVRALGVDPEQGASSEVG